MYKKFHSHVKSLSLLFIASLSVLIFGCQTTPVIEDLAREQLGVSILAVNLFDILNVPNSSSGVTWQTRYTRIFTWMKDTQTFPDVIALQEAPGFWSCPTDARRLPDYAAIDFLLDGIRDASGEQYRIAYLIAGKPHGADGRTWIGRAPAQFCTTQGGMALLYRPSRVRNVITQPGAGDIAISPYVEPFPLEVTYLARSVQCCSPASDRTDVCQVIDGPLDEYFMGTCQTPLGVAWTRSRRSTQGEDRNRPREDAIFSRFELVNQPGNYFHIYNVHRGWNQDWEDQHPGVPAPQILDYGSQNINQLVTDMESRFQSLGPTLYPPILVGDFNIGAPDPNEPFSTALLVLYFPRFEGEWLGPEVMGVLFGKSSVFPAKQKAYANLFQSLPELLPGEKCGEDPAKLWSDHCGIFFRIEPSKR